MSNKSKRKSNSNRTRNKGRNSFLKEKKTTDQERPEPPPLPTVPKKPTYSQLYHSIKVSKNRFNPEINPASFATICSLFCDAQPSETAGYFNWQPETNMIDWVWADQKDNKQYGGSVDYGTAIMRMAWEADGNSGIPNGQWHTHPGLTVYWSPTDMESQLRFCVEIIDGGRPDGYFCFIVLDQLDWLATKMVWENGQIVYRENGKVQLNGVPLSGVTKAVYTYPYAGYGVTYGNNYGTVFRGSNKQKQIQSTPTATVKQPESKVLRIPDEDQFKGDLPKDNNYYAKLFDMFFVPYFDWIELYIAIQAAFPGQYDDIVNESISWQWLEQRLSATGGKNGTDGFRA